MQPSLAAISQIGIASNREVVRQVSDHFKLTESEKQELLPSGKQRIIDNRVHWAITYMAKAGLIARPSRGNSSITDEGKKVLASGETINVRFLKRYDRFKEFHQAKPSTSSTEKNPKTVDEDTDPLEQLETTYQELKDATCLELLEKVRHIDPSDFERLVVRLMKAMGYGGSGEVTHLGQSGDGGIDGEIAQDPLGLDMIYIQAKRYQDGQGVGRPTIQQFVGSLNERKASKGVFVTTSHFSQDAREYTQRVDVKIVLIDGERLSKLMFDNNLGVATRQTYEVKEADQDFFDGEF